MINTPHLVNHYAKCWGNCSYEAQWRLGSRSSDMPKLSVCVFEPTAERALWVYATSGFPDSVERAYGIELFTLSPIESCLHIELFAAIAHLQWSGHVIDIGVTVNLGRGWLPKSRLSHGLISLPYTYGPDLEYFSSSETEQRSTRCLWLIPISESERNFKKSHGLNSLESLFQVKEIEYWNPDRDPVV